MWQYDTIKGKFIPGELPADGAKITACYDRLSQEDEQEPTQVVNHDRRNMVDVKSIAI